MSKPTIRARIDAGLANMVRDGLAVRAIYLSEADHDALDTEMPWKGMPTSVLDYEGHHIRRGKKSMIYSTHGVARALPALTRAKVSA